MIFSIKLYFGLIQPHRREHIAAVAVFAGIEINIVLRFGMEIAKEEVGAAAVGRIGADTQIGGTGKLHFGVGSTAVKRRTEEAGPLFGDQHGFGDGFIFAGDFQPAVAVVAGKKTVRIVAADIDIVGVADIHSAVHIGVFDRGIGGADQDVRAINIFVLALDTVRHIFVQHKVFIPDLPRRQISGGIKKQHTVVVFLIGVPGVAQLF